MKRSSAALAQRISQLESELEAVKEQLAQRRLTDTGDLRRRRHYLHEQINDHFDRSELIGLIYSLGIDPGKLPGESRDELSLQLVFYMQRHGRTDELFDRVADLRPLVEWKR